MSKPTTMGKVATKGTPFPTPAGDMKSSQGTGGLSVNVWNILLVVKTALHQADCMGRLGVSFSAGQAFKDRLDKHPWGKTPTGRSCLQAEDGLNDIPTRPIFCGSAGVQLRC